MIRRRRPAGDLLKSQLLASLLLASALISPASASSRAVAYRSVNPVTIDGKWTSPDEWLDAQEILVEGMALRVKHDGSSLYLLIDALGDYTSDEDYAIVHIDPEGDGGHLPRPGDRSFLARWVCEADPEDAFYWRVELMAMEGDGAGWRPAGEVKGFSAGSSMLARNDPHGWQTHLIWEFRIPLSVAAKGTSIRIWAGSFDVSGEGRVFSWPYARAFWHPGLWGEVEVSDGPMPASA